MRRRGSWCLVLVLLAGPVAAAPPEGKLINETWDAAYLDGSKAGHVHTTVRELAQDGQKILHSVMELQLTTRRYSDIISVRMAVGTDETPEGKVVGVSMRQTLGKDQEMVQTGTVEGDQLHIKVNGKYRIDKKNAWDDRVIGLYHQQRLFREHQVKPGDTFSYVSYEPEITLVVTTHVNVKDYEDVLDPITRKKQHLLRVEAQGDKIMGFQPPAVTTWLDKDLNPVRSQFDIPGLGKLLLQRSTRQVALGADSARMEDIGLKQLIHLNRRIPRPEETRAAVYRITVRGENDPATTFAHDSFQEIKNVEGHSFELHVQAVSEPDPVDDPAPVDAEFLKSSLFINCDDARVKELAHRAVGNETDAWKKAKRIERWVHDHMEENVNFTEALATADHVARTLEGDCTEHAMLAAAMCRVVGIPSQIAIGLLYVETTRGGPALGFHMWTEVYVRGQWVPIDPTMRGGYAGATHLKISDHSWYDTQSPTPLLPLHRVLGKVAIEVIGVTRAE